MKGPDLVVRSRRVVTPEGVRAASVVIENGIITSVDEQPPAGTEVSDFGDLVVMPGLVDTHVHVNEPGRAEWEGFETATRAAAAGGVTTIFDMPLNCIPPTTSLEALRAKEAAASGRCFVDVGFWGGVVPGNTGELAAMAERGVPGFKCFLVASGVPEFEHVGEADLRTALTEVARIGAVLLVHAEHPAWIRDSPPADARPADARRYDAYLSTRPAQAEDEAVALLAGLCAESGARTHVVHLSSSSALAEIGRARAAGLPLSVETCPHYLFFAAEDVPDGATEFKCAPPIRDRQNRERLWSGLAAGSIGMVVSDHSPSPPELKSRESGDFRSAWGGISSLELRLPAVWTAARARGHSVERLAEWLCAAPARLAEIADHKGAIAPGLGADLVVWNPEGAFPVRPEALHQRHALTPYAGETLLGSVEATFLAGERIFDRNGFLGPPRGRILLRDMSSARVS